MLKPKVLREVCDRAEHLRARAMALRYRYLVDQFCDLARDAGLSPSVQAERWISVKLPAGTELAVVPTIGVPTSMRINEVFDDIRNKRSDSCTIWLLYDNRGLLSSWLQHLDWLNMHLPVSNVRASVAGSRLAELLS